MDDRPETTPRGQRRLFTRWICADCGHRWLGARAVAPHPSTTKKLVPVTLDSTDANGAGWPRYYERTRLRTDTNYLIVGYGANKNAIFRWDAADFRVLGRTSRKPPPWARHRPQPDRMTVAAEVTFSGGTSTTATNLIPAGAYVLGVTSRITLPLQFGTATGYNIGTSANTSAWGVVINPPRMPSRNSPPRHSTARLARRTSSLRTQSTSRR